MNRLRIRHETGYRYEGEATASYNEARMLPTGSDGQLVLQAQLEIQPLSSRQSYVDYWGTRVSSFEETCASLGQVVQTRRLSIGVPGGEVKDPSIHRGHVAVVLALTACAPGAGAGAGPRNLALRA